VIDPRIIKYRDIAAAMKKGMFDVEIPAGSEDEIGQLGQALLELGHALKKQFDQFHMLCKITAQINAGLTLDEILNQIFESFKSLIPYDRIGFSLLEENGRVVRTQWVRSKTAAATITPGYTARMQGSNLQRIVETGQPRIINDLTAYLQEHPESESTRLIVGEGMRSSLTFPLVGMHHPIGFIFFNSMQLNTYQNSHVELFLQIAGQLSMIVEKSRLYDQLIELNQMKNRFLGIAAHDLRSPIAIIMNYVEYLLEGHPGKIKEKQDDILKKMYKVSEKMLNLVNELLDVNAIEAGRLELIMRPIDLTTYLKECYEENLLLSKAKSIELALDLEPGLPVIVMDPDRIDQVMNNLINNAIKFSYSNTTITLRARAQDQDVVISVQDQGQGIPAQEVDNLFTDFGKTSVRPTAGEKSTGLGLAIVKRIVELHGGRIWVESKVGVGSVFTFTLPKAARSV
jgi:signal transduction histidine kinase